jgi:hypothetical protein
MPAAVLLTVTVRVLIHSSSALSCEGHGWKSIAEAERGPCRREPESRYVDRCVRRGMHACLRLRVL